MSRNRNKNRGGASAASAMAAAPAVPAPRPAKRVGTMATWVATPFGVLMPGLRPAHTYDAGQDDRELQVRAREKAYLDRFRELYCPELGESLHFDQDYPWKAYVTRQALAKAMAAMTLDIDSEVFKPLTDGPKGLKGSLAHRLHSCYNSWWSTHLRYGDGTSSYDVGRKYASPAKSGGKVVKSWDEWVSEAGTGVSPSSVAWVNGGYADADRCERSGHWFEREDDRCVDCGAPKPNTWRNGDAPVYPGSEDYSQGNAVDSDTGWLEGVEDGEVENDGECPGCGAFSGHKSWCRLTRAAEAV